MHKRLVRQQLRRPILRDVDTFARRDGGPRDDRRTNVDWPRLQDERSVQMSRKSIEGKSNARLQYHNHEGGEEELVL